MMNIALHIDVSKATGCYSNVLTAKDALSADGVENPKVPIRVEEVEYGTYPKIKVDYIPIYDQGIEKVFGSDWKQLDFIVSSCPAGSVTCGDLDDPQSEISKIRAQGDFETLPAHYGASAPGVYYSNLPKRLLCGEVVFETDQGAGAAGVEVSLEGQPSELRTSTDGFGDFEFKGLDFDRTYVVTVSAPGFVAKKFTIEAGSHVDLGLIILEAE
ncbi:MAG: carboxypeptidase regulatory-like domain-containing protein [Desulfofustis sp.]|jgi:hypothetical protein